MTTTLLPEHTALIPTLIAHALEYGVQDMMWENERRFDSIMDSKGFDYWDNTFKPALDVALIAASLKA